MKYATKNRRKNTAAAHAPAGRAASTARLAAGAAAAGGDWLAGHSHSELGLDVILHRNV